MVSKRNTIIRNNRKYLVENMEPTDILIDRMVKFDCLTKKKADFVASLQHNTEKNHELLTVARSLSFKKHFAFIESLHFCGQLKVANVLEKGGVVVMAKIIHTRVSNSAEFIKRVNEKISALNEDHLENLNELLLLDRQETLEVLEVKEGGRKKNESSMVYLWCKSQKSLRKLRELLESDKLFKRFDILFGCLNSKKEGSLYSLYYNVHYKSESPPFLKRLTIDAMQFEKEVVVRQMSLMHSGSFDLPQLITALTSLDDKIYVLMGHLVSIHQDIAPFACQSRIAFPPHELDTSFRLHIANHRYFMVACDETKCIYIANDKDSHLWKLTTPEYELKVWISDIGDPFSVYVDRNGNVVLMRQGDASQAGNHHRMKIYNKDATLVHEILIFSVGLEPSWAMEILPGKLALNIQNNLLVREVDFVTLIADPDDIVIMFPKGRRRWANRSIAGITSYSEGQILVLLSKNLALFDSKLNVDIIPTSIPLDASKVHFKKDKRQLMLWSHNLNTVQIYTLEYKAEDMFADDP